MNQYLEKIDQCEAAVRARAAGGAAASRCSVVASELRQAESDTTTPEVTRLYRQRKSTEWKGCSYI